MSSLEQRTHHTIHFICPVTARSVQILQNVCLGAIRTAGASRIELRISSEGGDLAAGFAAYGFLRSLPIGLHTHNISNVESIAILMYLAGTVRTAALHSRFVVHPLHWNTTQGAVDHNRLNEWSESLNFDRGRYAAIFQETTNDAKLPIDGYRPANTH